MHLYRTVFRAMPTSKATNSKVNAGTRLMVAAFSMIGSFNVGMMQLRPNPEDCMLLTLTNPIPLANTQSGQLPFRADVICR